MGYGGTRFLLRKFGIKSFINKNITNIVGATSLSNWVKPLMLTAARSSLTILMKSCRQDIFLLAEQLGHAVLI